MKKEIIIATLITIILTITACQKIPFRLLSENWANNDCPNSCIEEGCNKIITVSEGYWSNPTAIISLPTNTRSLGALEFDTHDSGSPTFNKLTSIIIDIDEKNVYSGLSPSSIISDNPTQRKHCGLLSNTLSCGYHNYNIRTYFTTNYLGDAGTLHKDYSIYNGNVKGEWCITDNTCPDACKIPEPTEKPKSNGLEAAIKALGQWIIDLASKLKETFSLSITGPTTVNPGTTENYQIILKSPNTIDSNSADGTYQVRYCNIGLINKEGNVISEKGSYECDGNIETTYTLTIPDNPGGYAIIAIITQFNGTYNPTIKTWEWSPETVINQEAISLTNKAPIPINKPTSLGLNILKWFTELWNSIKNTLQKF